MVPVRVPHCVPQSWIEKMVMVSNVSFFEGSLEDDVVSGTKRGDYFFASFGNDTLSGLIGPDILRGSFGNDIIYGGEGADGLQGGDDDDQLFGEQGNDNLLGSAGNDVLDGGDGNDVLSGGPGRDRLIGGAGADLFVFGETRESTPGAPDRIEDFAAEDHIDLSSIDGQASAAGGQSLSFIGRPRSAPKGRSVSRSSVAALSSRSTRRAPAAPIWRSSSPTAPPSTRRTWC